MFREILQFLVNRISDRFGLLLEKTFDLTSFSIADYGQLGKNSAKKEK